MRYQTHSSPDRRPRSTPRGPAALTPCTWTGSGPRGRARISAQLRCGQDAATRLRRDRPEPTTGKITAAMTANKAGIHRR